MTGIPAKVRRAIKERDEGLCRRCGARATNIQHRIGRGMGGSKRPEINEDLAALVTMCGSGTTGCHGWATANPKAAEAAGWVIPRSSLDLPSEISLADLLGRRFFLTEEGDILYTSPLSAAGSAMISGRNEAGPDLERRGLQPPNPVQAEGGSR